MKKAKTQYHSLAVLFSLQLAFASISLNAYAIDLDAEIQKKNELYKELKLSINNASQKSKIDNGENLKKQKMGKNLEVPVDEFKVSLKKAETKTNKSNPF